MWFTAAALRVHRMRRQAITNDQNSNIEAFLLPKYLFNINTFEAIMYLKTFPFFAGLFVLTTISLFVLIFLLKNIFKNTNKTVERIIYLLFLFILSPTILYYSYKLIIVFDSPYFRPPYYYSLLYNNEDKALKDISNSLNTLSQSLSHLRKMNFETLQMHLEKVEQTLTKLKVQPSKLKIILGEIKEKEKDLIEIEKKIETMKSMSENELRIVEEIIDSKMKYLITLALGVLSSILGALFINRLTNSIKQDIS